ncbi:MAG TPA: cyclopropane-fatty-acyl-phospholipid synthase family protein [Trebonia sp.]|jgi:cyclopropane-fatty-acyl-phospholipid synthase
MTSPAAPATRLAAAAEAIRYHYDVGNEFYRLWLDHSLTYSCAMPDGPGDTLEAAQDRKLKFHLAAIEADRAGSVLDIGCGWGSLLRNLALGNRVPRCVGLTLSDEQAAYIRSRQYPGVEVRTEHYLSYEPDAPFDGIVSIGAFEHFARPDDTQAAKVAVYRQFFDRCRGWLSAGGTLSLQTIAYANMSRDDASEFMRTEVFPDADLPTLAEITAAADRIFEIQTVRNDRLDYAWTCEQWARRLREQREAARGVAGEETVARYERYLRLSGLGFRMGKLGLLRLVMRPYPGGYFGGTGATSATATASATATGAAAAPR